MLSVKGAATMEVSAPPTPLTPGRMSPGWHLIGDLAAVLVVLAAGVVAVRLGEAPPSLTTALSVTAAAAAVAARRRYPRAAVTAAILVAAVGLATGGPAPAYLVAGLITVFAVAASTDRRTTIAFALAAAAVATVVSLLFPPVAWEGARGIVQLCVQIGFAAAVGDATRSRRAYVDAVIERARRAEATKESEARRRVAEERLNIARDLHDVVAHQITVINLHAGVASQALRRNPEEVEQSLATIRQAARTVLGDIASLLNVLRASDPTAGADRRATAPVSGLAGLAPLIADFANSGLQVDVREAGRAIELPEAVDLVAYRVIQEALTNAQKHGADGSALLQLDYDNDMVEVTVTNTIDSVVRERSSSSAGLGLVGARERVAAVQGTLHTSYGPGPVHRLTARLPVSVGTGQSLPPLAGARGMPTGPGPA